MSLLAIIPARGGSKGVPGKNLKKIGGHSLIKRAIDAAQRSKAVSDIMITTDSDRIAEEGEKLGVPVPFRRSKELSNDTVGMADVVLDALERYKTKKGQLPEAFILLQPTSPFRTDIDIDQSYDYFKKTEAKSVVGVSEMLDSPYLCIADGSEGRSMLADSRGAVRRQDFEDKFCTINGALYLSDTAHFIKEKKFFDVEKSELFYMKALYGIDIDTPTDLMMAEALVAHPGFIDRMYVSNLGKK